MKERSVLHCSVKRRLELIVKLQSGVSMTAVYKVQGVKKQTVSDIRKQIQIIRNIHYSTLCKRQAKGIHEAVKISKFRRHYE
jgi:hypothetical protein